MASDTFDEQAIELADRFVHFDDDELQQEAVDTIAAALRAAAESGKPRWISVSERMPEVDKPVLLGAAEWVGVGVLKNASGPLWYSTTGSRLYEITHWQPLPDPPGTHSGEEQLK